MNLNNIYRKFLKIFMRKSNIKDKYSKLIAYLKKEDDFILSEDDTSIVIGDKIGGTTFSLRTRVDYNRNKTILISYQYCDLFGKTDGLGWEFKQNFDQESMWKRIKEDYDYYWQKKRYIQTFNKESPIGYSDDAFILEYVRNLKK